PRPAQPQRRRTRPQNRSLKLGSPPEVRDSPWRPRRQWTEREPAARRRTDRQAHLAYDLGVQHRPERVEVSGVCFHQIAAFARVRDEIIKLVSVVLHVVDELVPAIDQHPKPWLEGWAFRPRLHLADEGSPPTGLAQDQRLQAFSLNWRLGIDAKQIEQGGIEIEQDHGLGDLARGETSAEEQAGDSDDLFVECSPVELSSVLSELLTVVGGHQNQRALEQASAA